MEADSRNLLPYISMFYLGLKRRDKEARLDEVKAASAATKAALGAVSYGLGANTIHLRFICLFFVVVVAMFQHVSIEIYGAGAS